MRAREPDGKGTVERDGVRVGYDVYGDGEPVLVLLTSWPIPDGFDTPRESYDGWEKANRHYWLHDYRGWVEFFMSQVFTEPHSSKHREDGVGWETETDAETLLLTGRPGIDSVTAADAEATCRQVRCPVLVVHGEQAGAAPGPGDRLAYAGPGDPGAGRTR